MESAELGLLELFILDEKKGPKNQIWMALKHLLSHICERNANYNSAWHLNFHLLNCQTLKVSKPTLLPKLRLVCLCVCMLSRVWLFAILVAHQAPLSMEFSRQEYWSGLLFPTSGDLPHPGIKPVSPALAGRFFTTVPLGRPRWSQWEGILIKPLGRKFPWWFSG